jgi:hypothetical protein
MAEGYRGSNRLDVEEYLILFEFVKRTKGGGTIREAVKELGKHRYRRNRTTVAGVLNVVSQLRDREEPRKRLAPGEDSEIAKKAKYHVSPHGVNIIFQHFRDWLQGDLDASEQGREHRSLLKAEVKNLRSCLLDPRRLPEIPDYREPLMIGNRDWRLDPVTWFHLCAPDFTNLERWGESFLMLKQHMKEGSFWDNYGKLWRAVLKLENDYQRAAAKLQGKYEEFRGEWVSINVSKERRRRGIIPRPSRYPGVSEEALDQFESSYRHDYCERVLTRLMQTKVMLDIHDRLLALEVCLVQLSKDLVSHDINPIIDKGYCNHPSCR